jgi:hypothetical protein
MTMCLLVRGRREVVEISRNTWQGGIPCCDGEAAACMDHGCLAWRLTVLT